MKRFSNVLFASDFDHTLTDQQGRIPRENVEAVEYFIANGGIFTVASGRSIPMFASRYETVPTNAPCILYNGAACYDYPSQTLHYAYPLDGFAQQVVQKVRREHPHLTVEMQGQTHHYISGEQGWREEFLRSQNVPFLRCEGEIPQPWMKLVITDGQWRLKSNNPKDVPPEYAEEFIALAEALRDFCGARCYVTRSMPTIIEISNPKGSKGRAARALAERYGRSILACAGDAPNDETMLREADFAFAPVDRDPGLQGDFFRQTVSCNLGCVADAVAKLEKLL